MPNLLIRDIDDQLLGQLKSAAKTNGRSLQAEIHDALARAGTRSIAETRKLSSAWLKRLQSSQQSDSAKLIRETRNKR